MATLADLQAQRAKFFQQKGEQAQGQIRGQTQENVGALQRRFTSMGAGNTGAALAAEEKARQTGLEQERQAMGDISGQQLQAGEQDIGRQFQSEEARMAREAQLGEAEKARQFQRGMAEQDIGFKRELAGQEQQNKMREMDMAYQQFLIDKDTTAFNKRLSALQAGISLDETGMPLETLETKKKREAEMQDLRDQLIRAQTIGSQGGSRNIDTTSPTIIVDYKMERGVRTPIYGKNPFYQQGSQPSDQYAANNFGY